MELAQYLGTELVKSGRSSYRTKDGEKGFVISTSKMYVQGNREKYWFAYRRNPLKDIEECKEQFIVYGCKDENTLIKLPVYDIEKKIECLNVSKDEDGSILHWHIVFFKDSTGKITWLLSKPQLEEIDITDYRIK